MTTALPPATLDACQWCHRAVAGPLDACDKPDCQDKDRQLAALFGGVQRRNAALAADPDNLAAKGTAA